MRTRLVANLLSVLRTNLDRGSSDVQIFEVGSVFLPPPPGAHTREPLHAAGLVCGRRASWLADPAPVDFFDVRAAVEALLGGLGLAPSFEASHDVAWLHPGVSAVVRAAGRELGVIGEVHPRLRARFGIEAPAFVFELELEGLSLAGHRQMTALPRYPQVLRDVSLLMDAGFPAAAVEAAIRGADEPLLVSARILEDYRDPAHVPAGKKATLWSLTYRSNDRTLTDAEVEAAHERIVVRVCATTGGSRR
jgi:phenylalanyl-tRNA synthetase beta chain